MAKKDEEKKEENNELEDKELKNELATVGEEGEEDKEEEKPPPEAHVSSEDMQAVQDGANRRISQLTAELIEKLSGAPDERKPQLEEEFRENVKRVCLARDRAKELLGEFE